MTTIKLIPSLLTNETTEKFLTRAVDSVNNKLSEWSSSSHLCIQNFSFDGVERKFIGINAGHSKTDFFEMKNGFTPDDVLTALLKVIKFPAMYSANENMTTFFEFET